MFERIYKGMSNGTWLKGIFSKTHVKELGQIALIEQNIIFFPLQKKLNPLNNAFIQNI